MKKDAIGCLGALGFIAVVIVAVVIINSVFMPKDNDTTPTGLATMTTTTLAAVAVELSAAEDEGLIGVSTFSSGYKNKCSRQPDIIQRRRAKGIHTAGDYFRVAVSQHHQRYGGRQRCGADAPAA